MHITLEIVEFQERTRVRNLLKTKKAILRQERKSSEVVENSTEQGFGERTLNSRQLLAPA
jgi:hypothetical protein